MQAANRALLNRGRVHWILFLAILGLGIFARTWEYRTLPPSLTMDEAGIGVEGYDLLHFGTDRNGIQFPVSFIAFGGGDPSTVYGYLLIPFIAILGLKPEVVRLPMLLSGIATLPLVYFIGTRTGDRRLGMLTMFLLAISPWHIIISRRAMDSNILPFVFSLGYACLLAVINDEKWFVVACVFFGLSLYAYAPAYAIVPVFMLLATLSLWRKRLIRLRTVVWGGCVLCVLAAPIALLIIVNTLKLSPIMLGPMTVPRFPVQARYVETTVLGSAQPIREIATNLWAAIKLLIVQDDGDASNVVAPFGYFYTVTFPAALLGILLLIRRIRASWKVEHLLLIAWIGASFVSAIMQKASLIRLNVIFIPLLLCTAIFVDGLDLRYKGALVASVLVLLPAFAAFSLAYHSDLYRQQVSKSFNPGLLEAIRFARSKPGLPTCFTGKISSPYIYALFDQPMNPEEFLSTVKYADPQEPLRRVVSYGDYAFGIQNCRALGPYTYVLRPGDGRPRFGNRYQYDFFDNFAVFYPKP